MVTKIKNLKLKLIYANNEKKTTSYCEHIFMHFLSKGKWQIKIGLKFLMYLMYVPSPTYGVRVMLCGLSVGTRLRKPANKL